jgi:hypothetical protein
MLLDGTHVWNPGIQPPTLPNQNLLSARTKSAHTALFPPRSTTRRGTYIKTPLQEPHMLIYPAVQRYARALTQLSSCDSRPNDRFERPPLLSAEPLAVPIADRQPSETSKDFSRGGWGGGGGQAVHPTGWDTPGSTVLCHYSQDGVECPLHRLDRVL